MATRARKPGKAARKRPASSVRRKDAVQGGGFDAAATAAWQKSMTPSAGHARLEPLVGRFVAKTKIWFAPGAPPQEGAGTSKNRWTLGGRFLEQVYGGKSMGMPFEGIGYTGYDNAARRYVGTWMDNFSTGLMTSLGTGRPTTKKIEFACRVVDPMTGQEGSMRAVVRIESRDRHDYELWTDGPDGNRFRTLLVEYTRE